MDIIPIAILTLKQLADNKGVRDFALSPDIMGEFIKYHWPGNIRELINVLTREVSYLDVGELTIHKIYEKLNESSLYKLSTANRGIQSLNDVQQLDNKTRTSLSEAEKEVLINVLIKENGNINRAAKKLNIARNTLYKRIETYDIIVEEFKK